MKFQNLGLFGEEKEKSIMKPFTGYKYVDPTSSGRDSHDYKIKEDYLNDLSLFLSPSMKSVIKLIWKSSVPV